MRVLIIILLFLVLVTISKGQDIPQDAWLAEYFDARGNVISTRIEPSIKHDFNKVVMPGVQKEGLGAKWTGNFQVGTASRLKIKSDKSIRVLLQDQEILADLGNNAPNTYTADISTGLQKVVIEYNLENKVVINTQDSIWIDDSEIAKLDYYGNWRISDTLAIPEQDGNCYCSWASTSTDSVVLRFTGATEFQWIGEQMSHHGVAYLYLNDVFQTAIDTYDPNNKRLTVNWSIDGLDSTQVYKFRIVVGGEKNPASTGTAVVVQGFVLKKEVPVIEPPPIDPPVPGEQYLYQIIRSGRFQVFMDGVQHEGEHNEYEKAIEHALQIKALNPEKNVIIKSPIRRVEIK